MLEAIIKRLKRDKRGVSNVIVVMLSLPLIVVIVANVVLWSYQMNQFDWNKMQENLTLLNVTPFGQTWSYNPSAYTLGGSTSRLSGSVSDLTADDGVYMTFRSYTETDTIDFVDQTCDLYPPPAKGTHSNFTAQQYGPDGIHDTLTEENTVSTWLSGWDERARITIDHNDVDGALSDFPVLVYLSNSSGGDNDDVTFIFDEVGSNSKKIAVTTSDGETQCYVEIEKWNATSEQAWLWVKVPSISNTTDTDLYLYYDNDHTDNENYIGYCDSIPAMNVWDSNYMMVQHLEETSKIAGSYNDHLDSTSNDNDGEAEMEEGHMDATGKIDGADDFDGSDDSVNCGSDTSLNIRNAVTLEAWINMDQDPGSDDWYDVIGKPTYCLYLYSEDGSEVLLSAYFKINGKKVDLWNFTATDINPNEWTRVVITFDGTDIKGYVNDQLDGTKDKAGTIDDSSSDELFIGAHLGEENYRFDGKIDEVRISNTARSLAWIGASYESERDDLLDFGSEETPNYELDLEIQWTNVDYDETNERLCIYAGDLDAEDLSVDYWDGDSWESIDTDLDADSWNNYTISLASPTYTIRFKDGTNTSDTTPNSWDIDVTLLHVWTESSEYAVEVEFTGSSNTEDWSQLNWTVNCAWTVSSVNVTLQLYNYTLDSYSTSGNGYMAYTSDDTPNTDENKSQTINVNPIHFIDATGHWKIKIKGVKTAGTPFDFKVDWIEFKVAKVTATLFTFRNEGPLTSHVVSLWINNATHHQRYDTNIFINSGDTKSYIRSDVTLPNKPYTVKVVTERGNTAVFASH